MGAGLLVGTALSVIIPEGMNTLVMAYSKEQCSLHLSQPARRKEIEFYSQINESKILAN